MSKPQAIWTLRGSERNFSSAKHKKETFHHRGVAVCESEPPTVLTVAPPTETLRNPACKPVITNDFNEKEEYLFIVN